MQTRDAIPRDWKGSSRTRRRSPASTGSRGKLYYRGYSIEDLAAHSDFEEVTYLLLYEKLPTARSSPRGASG